MPSVMHFECPTRSQNRLGLSPPLRLQLANKKTSPTFELLAVGFGFDLQDIAQLSHDQTLEKGSSLVMFRTPLETSCGVMSRLLKSKLHPMPDLMKA